MPFKLARDLVVGDRVFTHRPMLRAEVVRIETSRSPTQRDRRDEPVMALAIYYEIIGEPRGRVPLLDYVHPENKIETL